jgi:hypothetical protein
MDRLRKTDQTRTPVFVRATTARHGLPVGSVGVVEMWNEKSAVVYWIVAGPATELGIDDPEALDPISIGQFVDAVNAGRESWSDRLAAMPFHFDRQRQVR